MAKTDNVVSFLARDGSDWNEAKSIYAKHDGSWESAKGYWRHNGNRWVQYWGLPSEVTFRLERSILGSGTAGETTYYGVATVFRPYGEVLDNQLSYNDFEVQFAQSLYVNYAGDGSGFRFYTEIGFRDVNGVNSNQLPANITSVDLTRDDTGETVTLPRLNQNVSQFRVEVEEWTSTGNSETFNEAWERQFFKRSDRGNTITVKIRFNT